jgi:hypothetical protein
MTGSLVNELKKYMTEFQPPAWSREDVEKIHKFLSSFSVAGRPEPTAAPPPRPAPAPA